MQWHVSPSALLVGWSRPAAMPVRPGNASSRARRRLAVIGMLMSADAMAAGLALAIGEVILPSADAPWPDIAIALVPVAIGLHACLGLYARWGACPIERLRLRALSALALGALMLATSAAWTHPAELASLALCIAIFFLSGHYLEGLARFLLMRRGLWGVPTLLIGSPERCALMARTLLAHPKLGLRPIGLATDLAPGMPPPELPLPILSGLADVNRLTALAEIAIIAAPDLVEHSAAAPLSLSQLRFAHVIVTEDGGGLPNLGLRTRNLGDALGIEVRFDLFRSGHLALKRIVDLAIALPAFILAAPVVALLALAIKAVDPGPAFYRQRRIGHNGQSLDVLKLRTMYGDAQERLDEHLRANPEARAEWARFFKLSADPRILPIIGGFLRRSSLDELPQLWNILRGEMSIVGPRPFPAYHMDSFDPAFQALRVSVPPGLTGMWQVSARSGGDIAVQKAQDLFYIRNWSIWLDLYIIMETVPAVLSARGAR